MRVVVDTNVVAASLIRPSGRTASQLSRKDVAFLLPQFVLEELSRHEEEFLAKAGSARGEWRRRVERLRRSLRVVPTTKALRLRSHPLVEATRDIDPRDAIVVASFLAAKADFLWTYDAALCDLLPGLAGEVIPSKERDSDEGFGLLADIYDGPFRRRSEEPRLGTE